MSYQALYRAWRPPSFADMVHQPHVKQTLQNAISRGQVAHAYLFCGPRGTGKTSAAKILAKAVNCLRPNGADPCNECAACRSINDGSNVDVEEIDAASNRGVDEIRQLRDKVQYAPASLSKKVYIVDEVHMLTPEAFNALLKTLEEPPQHVLFVLATTEPHKLPETIISRCQRFDFRRIPDDIIVDRLRQICQSKGWAAHEDALWHIAAAADGGLRDALGLLEQTSAYGGGEISAENAAHVVGGVPTAEFVTLIRAIASRDLLSVLQRISDWHAMGKDTGRILAELLHVMRDLFIVKLTPQERMTQETKQAILLPAAESVSVDWLLQAVKQLGELYTQLRYIDQPRIALEASLVGLASATDSAASTVAAAAPLAKQPDMCIGEAHGIPTASERPIAAVERPHTEPSGQRPQAASADTAEVTSTSASAPSKVASSGRAPRGNSQRRKLEVLQTFAQSASTEVLREVEAVWNDILQRVKSGKIQTYAWLMGGKPVLATVDMAIVAFSVQIHRDNVMKPEERQIIETAMTDALGKPMRFQAILLADWDAYMASQAQPDRTPSESDWVQDVVELFGEQRVDIRMEE